MPTPTIIRPVSGKRILVSLNVKPESIRYLLRRHDRAVPDKHLKAEPYGWASLPAGRLGKFADILASDRGACLVQLHYSTSQLCTVPVRPHARTRLTSACASVAASLMAVVAALPSLALTIWCASMTASSAVRRWFGAARLLREFSMQISI
jgi:hypothetical protein